MQSYPDSNSNSRTSSIFTRWSLPSFSSPSCFRPYVPLPSPPFAPFTFEFVRDSASPSQTPTPTPTPTLELLPFSPIGPFPPFPPLLAFGPMYFSPHLHFFPSSLNSYAIVLHLLQLPLRLLLQLLLQLQLLRQRTDIFERLKQHWLMLPVDLYSVVLLRPPTPLLRPMARTLPLLSPCTSPISSFSSYPFSPPPPFFFIPYVGTPESYRVLTAKTIS